ncbi:hypothetical protein POTOM_014543 [Populus tomentosa]|uniref:Uncharacterized protein n=1 Tax=Populus tomentosa TaxID=118781 RepID=A0A8X8A7T8_POPTO|nr:hypothetical protein POTOM_014543 [Populus tomentosa]
MKRATHLEAYSSPSLLCFEFFLAGEKITYKLGMHKIIGNCTGTWRSVEAVREFFEMHWPNRYDAAFVNGSLHWLVRSDLGNPTCIFNFETQQFGSFLLPPPDSDGHDTSTGEHRRHLEPLLVAAVDAFILLRHG